MSLLERSEAQKYALRSRLVDVAHKHSQTCICGVCRFAFPECYAKCDCCDAWSLKEDMHGFCGDSPIIWCQACNETIS